MRISRKLKIWNVKLAEGTEMETVGEGVTEKKGRMMTQ